MVRVRPFDVATFVAFGAAHIGVCGADVLMEFDYPRSTRRSTSASPTAGSRWPSRWRPPASDDASRWSRVTSPPSTRTSHGGTSPRRGVQAEIVSLSGAMELAPSLGLSRLIVDLVPTGSTLKANGLVETEVIAQRHLAPDRQPHRAEDPAGTHRRLDRPLPQRPGRRRMIRLDTREPGFEAAFEAPAGQRAGDHRAGRCRRSPRSSAR